VSDRETLLGAVRARPDEDGPRLQLADWYAENGQRARAEFIRLQIERAALPAGDDRHAALHARELRLLAGGAADWLAGPPLRRRTRFRRGFGECLAGPAADVLEQMPEAVRLSPIREVRLTNLGARDGLGAALAERPEWEHVDTIKVDDMAGDMAPAEQLVRLFSGPHLRRVRRLTLFCGECNADVFRRLLALPALQQVEELHFNGGMTADDVVGVLDEFRLLPLTKLRIHKGPYGSWALSLGGLARLADSGHWRRLTELNVGIQADPQILARIALGLPHSRIHTLWLHQGIQPGAEDTGYWMYSPGRQDYGLEAFAAAPLWGPLRDLRFEYIEFNKGQLRSLLAAPSLPRLTRLSFFGGMLGPEEGAAVFGCQRLAGLRTLELSCNFKLTSAAAGAVAGSRHLTNLADLKLIWVQGGDALAEAVAGAPHFARLRNLELANNFVTARGMEALARSPHLTRLNRLRLFEYPVGPWQRLLGNPRRELFRLTPAATTALATGLPGLGCLELHGYEFPGECFAPLLAAGERLWVTAFPEQIESASARAAYVKLANSRGWLPPLDEYQEEEEMHP
jgi:uncharacterized protein (TIGR02996 family)